MSDIYHIPGDDGKTYRLEKFVEYQHEVPETHYRFVGEYSRRKKFNNNQKVNIAFLLSETYSEITTVFLTELLKKKSPEEVWKMKNNLNFGSARKYVKNNDEFANQMRDWEKLTRKRPYEFIKKAEGDNPMETYNSIHEAVKAVNGVGRFAADLFLETIIYLRDDLGIKVEQPTVLDWKNCANLTSGIFNIFYEDERANEYDKTKKVTDIEKKYLTGKLVKIQKEIQETYPNQDAQICMFIGKICSFRNLFKNARYGGFHHDRQLGVLKEYERTFPEYQYLWDECYRIRKDIFPERFLGELHGWDGIRKERKKIWLTTGKTGVEDE